MLTDSGAAALGLVFNVNLFIAVEPTEPDAAVTLYDTGGYDPDVQNGLDAPTFSVGVRDNGYLAGFGVAEEVRQYLKAITNFTVNGTRYLAFWPVGDINSLGFDEKNRPRFSLNFRTMRTAT